jgi:hypothetical protein
MKSLLRNLLWGAAFGLTFAFVWFLMPVAMYMLAASVGWPSVSTSGQAAALIYLPGPIIAAVFWTLVYRRRRSRTTGTP